MIFLSIKGKGASKGIAKGTVVLAFDIAEAARKIAGAEDPILVTMATDPSFTVLLSKVRGVVTDIGNMLCHAAIVAREYGIPAVVGTRNATQRLKDGQKIVIDGLRGEVHVL